MSETKFTKRRKLTTDEVVQHINGFGKVPLGGSQNGIPNDTEFVAKITGELVEEYNEKTNKTYYQFPVEYHAKGYNPEYIQFMVTVSEVKARKLVQEKPDYIGKNCIFGKGMIGYNVFHSLGLQDNSSNTNTNAFVPPTKITQVNQEIANNPTDPATSETVKEKIKDWEFPEEIKEWCEGGVIQGDTFIEMFPTLKEFAEYVRSPHNDRAEYFQKLNDGNSTVAKIYYKVKNIIDDNNKARE